MRLLVIGGSGRTGKLVIDDALARGKHANNNFLRTYRLIST